MKIVSNNKASCRKEGFSMMNHLLGKRMSEERIEKLFSVPETMAIWEKILNNSNYQKLNQMIARKEQEFRKNSTIIQLLEEYNSGLQKAIAEDVKDCHEQNEELQKILKEFLSNIEKLTENEILEIVKDYIPISQEHIT